MTQHGWRRRGGDTVSVPGYRGPGANATVVHDPEGTDSVVVVGPTPTAVERAVELLVDGAIRAETLSDRTAVVRNTTRVSETGDDGDATDGGDDGSDDETPTGPASGPSSAPRSPGR